MLIMANKALIKVLKKMVNRTYKLLLIAFIYALGITLSQADSQQLYKWVDDQGVTHYGDALPDENIAHESFHFQQYSHISNPSDDYYSIQNQLQRLQERRSQALKQKQQAAEIKAANNSVSQQPTVAIVEPERRYFAPAYFPHRYNKHYKYIPGKPHHYNKHVNSSKAPVERSRGGLVSRPTAKRGQASFSASK